MKTPHSLLIVDDEAPNLQKLKRTFIGEYQVLEARSGEEALDILRNRAVSAIITDQRMPGLSGVELLRRSLELRPDVVRIVLTGYTEVEDLMDAINRGQVHRYITKPWEPFGLQQCVRQELERLELQRENERLAEELQVANSRLTQENVQLRQEVRFLQNGHSELLYASAAMKELIRMIDRVLDTDSTVLIQGETGTGKEMLARYIQRNSPRRDAPFVPVNCGAIPADLTESAFFGHEEGAFTGATKTTRGYFELADAGILFLDEVGEAPLELQVKLLRVLQDGEIMSVGGQQSKKIDVRVIASTNRDLQKRVDEGSFRRDLYYRLNVFNIRVPPLRSRPEDVELLARHFLERQSRQLNKELSLHPETIGCMEQYQWPGNVRELENEIERLAILAEPGGAIAPPLLSARIRSPQEAVSPAEGLKDKVFELERRLILEALEEHHNNKSHAAKSLGITRQTIIAKLKQYEEMRG